MSWGDQETPPRVKATLGLLREGGDEFQKLVAITDDAELVDKLAGLDQSYSARSCSSGSSPPASYPEREERDGSR